MACREGAEPGKQRSTASGQACAARARHGQRSLADLLVPAAREVAAKGASPCHELRVLPEVALCNQVEQCDQLIREAELSPWQKFKAAFQMPCICQRQWAHTAREIIAKNGLEEAAVCKALKAALFLGLRKKQDAVCFAGSGNEGKSFILRPLFSIFARVFTNPAKGSCPLLDLPRAECVLLDDWRPETGALDVSTWLLWLEGGKLRINRPLNLFSSHEEYQPNRPTFVTCNWQALHIAKGRWTDSELCMLRARLQIFVFQHRLQSLRDIPSCPCCFAMLVLSGGRNISKFVDQGFPLVK